MDSARVKLNRQPWSSDANQATLSGAGVGMHWFGPNQWRASAVLAAPIGARPVMLAQQSSVRTWVTFGKAF